MRYARTNRSQSAVSTEPSHNNHSPQQALTKGDHMNYEISYYDKLLTVLDNMVENGMPLTAIEILRILGVSDASLPLYWVLRRRVVEPSRLPAF